MLRKLALAVGAVAFCGAIQSQAAFYSSHDKGGQYGGDSYKGDEGDKGDCFKIDVPEFDSNCDLVKWIQTLDSKQSHGNVFDELVNGCNPKDLGFCLPKCEMKILDDVRSDIKDVEKDFDKLKDRHGGKHDGHKSDGHDNYGYKDGHDDHDTKELRDDIKCDLTDIRQDICQFAEGLKYDCHPAPSGPPVVPSTSAVPLPAAASQGLVGLALVGCLSLLGTARRRVFARA